MWRRTDAVRYGVPERTETLAGVALLVEMFTQKSEDGKGSSGPKRKSSRFLRLRWILLEHTEGRVEGGRKLG